MDEEDCELLDEYKEEDDEEEMCTVCLDSVSVQDQGFLPKCVHCFHFECIFRWAQEANRCPVCKTSFKCIMQKDEQGNTIKTTAVAHAKQKIRADASQDIAANRNLLNEYACMLCGNGDNEDTLLLCSVDNCDNACHTFCLAIPDVPNSSWFCLEHEHRRNSMATTRRRATTLATLRSSRRGRQSIRLPRRMTRLEAKVGIRRGQRIALPIEAEVARYRNEPVYNRRSVAMSEMRRLQQEAASILQRKRPQLPPAIASLPKKRKQDDLDQMWQDSVRAKQIATLTPAKAPVTMESFVAAAAAPAPPPSFRSKFQALKQKMSLAATKDSSTAVYLVPTATKLRLLPDVKAFFNPMNLAQQRQVLEWEILKVFSVWLQPYGPGRCQHRNILDGVLQILLKLPIEKDHLKQSDGLGHAVLAITKAAECANETKALARQLLDNWARFVHKPQTQTKVEESPVTPLPLPSLPVITPIAHTRHRKQKSKIATHNGTTRTLKSLPYCDSIVHHVKQQLYPKLKAGDISKERFTDIVKQVSNTFAAEVPFLSNAVANEDNELTSTAKGRLDQLTKKALK
ncbi:hypothetical protein THRCLA_08521 [Thraustotheca clavata]|uniref:RING-type domain-containing protein n=1 Tax=Thraustotheca clavata TaxID=74557 RepID=A0A1V9Z5E7_9STRA|nr:hypothetical protein THRCLA_08521 [Thraustotheca clavata]